MTIPSFPSLIGVAFPVKKSPVWNTIKQPTISGKEGRVPLYTYPLYKYELPFTYLSAKAAIADWQTLIGFYNAVNGAGLPFHFSDPYDNAITSQLLGTGDGSTVNFFFARGLGSFVEPVQDAIQSGAVIKVNGVTKTAGVDFTFGATTQYGTTDHIAFGAAPGGGLPVTASFSFNWLCNFDDDSVEFDNFAFNFWELKKLAFTSIKQ